MQKKILTMLWQHSQYDSRLGFSFRVLVRVRVRLTLILTPILTLKSTQTLTQNQNPNSNPKPNLTLTKTLKLNTNLLSYWECCRNMVRKKRFAARMAIAPGWRGSMRGPETKMTLRLEIITKRCLLFICAAWQTKFAQMNCY